MSSLIGAEQLRLTTSKRRESLEKQKIELIRYLKDRLTLDINKGMKESANMASTKLHCDLHGSIRHIMYNDHFNDRDRLITYDAFTEEIHKTVTDSIIKELVTAGYRFNEEKREILWK